MSAKCKNKELTLALSIFKGVNFCVRKLGGFKSKIVCKLGDSVLESASYQLPTYSNEFELNLQTEWVLSPEELKKLQEENETVKIECYLLNKAGKINSIIGYCTISVKEAFEISIDDQIDIENLEFVPLKGAKQPWVGFGPQLQILLSLQDPMGILSRLKPKDKNNTSKMVQSKQNVERKAPLAPPSLEREFLWSVNEEIGCLQLGNPSSDDNLYVLIIVIKEAQNLENLLNPKPSIPELENYKWMIRFNCFGRVIESYDFSFDSTEENSQIFVGHKFQVRVRANEVEFNRFLSGFKLKMRIGTICNASQFELQGAGRISLKNCTDNSVIESVITIAPQNLVVVPENFAPKLSYIFTVKKSRRHFEINNNCVQPREISPGDESLNVPKEDDESELQAKEDGRVIAEVSSSQTNWNGDSKVDDSEVKISRVSTFLAEDEESLTPPTSYHQPQSMSPPDDEGRVQSETNQIPNQQQRRQSNEPLALPLDLDGQLVPDNLSAPILTTTHTAATILLTPNDSRPNQEGDSQSSSAIETSDLSRNSNATSSLHSLSGCGPPGPSHLSLYLDDFYVKAKITLEDDWIVSLVHPLLSLAGTDNEFIARIDGVKDKVYKFVCQKDQRRKPLDDNIPLSSPKSIPDSIVINFYSRTRSSKAEAKSSGRVLVATSQIPINSILTAKKDDLGQNIKGRCKIYPSHSKKASKIGYLNYKSILTSSLDESSSFSNSTAVDPPLDHNELFSSLGSTSENTSVDIDWNSQQTSVFEISDEQFLSEINSLLKQRLKEKDEAFGRLLSQECKNQKEQSERAAIAIAANKLEKSKFLAEQNEVVRFLQKKEELVKMKELELADAMDRLDRERELFEEQLQEKEKESNHDIFPQEVEQIVTAIQMELNISATEHEQLLQSMHEEEEMLKAREQLTVSSNAKPLNALEDIPRAELERSMKLLENRKIKAISASEKRLSKALQDLEIAKGQIGALSKKLCFKDKDILKLILQKTIKAEKQRELKNFQHAEGKLIQDLAKEKREMEFLRNELRETKQKLLKQSGEANEKQLKSSKDEARLKMLSEREAELFNKKIRVNPE